MPVAAIVTSPTAFQPINATLTFLTARMTNGWAVDLIRTEAEELSSPGVDGKRYREIFGQYPEFDMETLADFTTYALAIAAARKYISITHYNVDLSMTLSGALYKIRRAHILAVEPIVSPGYTVGSGVTAGATAIVSARWRIAAARL